VTGQLPNPAGYLCVVRAEGHVQGIGTEAGYLFDAVQSASPVLALRWLHHQALYLARQMDPDPGTVNWAPRGAFHARTSACDPGGELRAWAAYFAPRGEAHRLLRDGTPVTAVVEDRDVRCRFVLSALPIRALVGRLHPEPPPWSPEPYGSPPPDDQGGTNHRGKHRRAWAFA